MVRAIVLMVLLHSVVEALQAMPRGEQGSEDELGVA